MPTETERIMGIAIWVLIVIVMLACTLVTVFQVQKLGPASDEDIDLIIEHMETQP